MNLMTNIKDCPLPFEAVKHLPGQSIGVIAPHPDDEVFGCGCALAEYASRGCNVEVIVLTDGQLWADTQSSRVAESISAAKVLGYPQPVFWHKTDGGLQNDQCLVDDIAHWLMQCKHDALLIPSPWEKHPDHTSCTEATINALNKNNHTVKQLIFYEVGHPLASCNMLLDTTAWQPLKISAMQCFTSQLSKQNFLSQISGLNAYRAYSLPMSCYSAEAFYKLELN